MKEGYLPKDQRKKILFLCDDIRMHSGVATMAREIVIGTCHRYNWINAGAAINHPEVGKKLDLSQDGTERFIVRALTRIEDFNDYFQCELNDEEYDTIGGLVMHELGRLPGPGEKVEFGGFKFIVLKADERRIDVLQMQRRNG